jgi:replicative DNA helicase
MRADQAVLGALIQDIDAMERVETTLTADNFPGRRERQTYELLRKMYSDGESVDLMTLHHRIETEGMLEDLDASYIASLTSTVPTAANVEYYAAQVREEYIRKQLHKIGLRLVETSEDKSKDTNEIIEKAERLIFEMNEIQTGQYTHARVPLKSAVDLIEEYYNRKGGYLGIPCGLKAVDDVLSGFQPEDLIVIGARASIGKTALAMTMAANMARERPVGFFSLEMSARALLVRLISMYGRVPNNRIRYGMLSESDLDGIHKAGNDITDGKLYIYDQPNASIMDIKAKARRMKKREGIEAVFVDYIGLIQPDRRDLPRHEQISSVCKELKSLAREIRVPVIALAQLNRLAEGKKPGLSELKGSGALEEDADVVMLLHRERGEEGNERETELNIAKHRNGPTDKVPLIYLPHYTRFESYRDGAA